MKICYRERDPAAMLDLLADCTLVLMGGSEVKAGKPDAILRFFLLYRSLVS